MLKEQNIDINQAIRIARELHVLLHEDALHRLRLYKEYAREGDTLKWSPNLYQRCQLAEALCRTLDRLNN